MKEQIRRRARELGFDDCRFTTAASPDTAPRFKAWLAGGEHGEMGYLERTAHKRIDPSQVLAGARSIITLAISYATKPADENGERSAGRIYNRLPVMNRAGHAFTLPLLRAAVRFLVFSQIMASAWAATNSFIPYGVRIWQTDDGLPQNSVFAIAQTADGYLWVGTHEGLARFDGIRFEALDEKAAPELKHGWITALCAAADGSLWIACDGAGVSCLKNRAFSHFSETDGLPSNQTRCLLQSKDNAIWIGSEGGLTRFEKGKLTNFTVKHGLADNSVRAICEDSHGNIRIATRRGLSSLDRQGVISTVNFEGFIANALKSVCEDHHGNIWVAANDGVNCLQGAKKLFYGPNDGLPDKIATAVFEDHQGQVWIGTFSGLACVVNEKVITRPLLEGAFGDLIYTIFEDYEKNIWVGGRDGLYRLNPGRCKTYTTQQGLSCDNVMSVIEDRAGAVWIATWGGGVNRLQNGKISSFGSTNGLTHDFALSLHEGRDDSLWIGMEYGGGLNRFKQNCQNSFPKQDGMINAAIRVIYEDQSGAVWIGTSRGLNIFKHDKFQTYGTAQGLGGETVLAICEDTNETCWIGTDGGLTQFHGGKFHNFTTRDGLANNMVEALYKDQGQTLWIGTKGGLTRFKAGKFSSCNTRQGLFSDEIYEILEDDYGYFWMSCRNGIFRVSKQQIEDLADDRIKTVSSTSFGKADGLVSVQCNGVAKPAGWKAQDGRLWFPTIRGVVAVESRIKTNDRPPPVVIEEIMADKRLVSESQRGWATASVPLTHSRGDPITLPPSRGELEIHYTALSFQAPEKNRFKYKLEGIDSDWIEAGARRSANYNNLGPGKYVFHVIACNNDGVWNQNGATLAVIFLPHYWQTWWFKLTGAAALIALLGSFYRARVARFREIERLRIQIAADLHDDVGSRLTKVAMVSELLDRNIAGDDRNKPQIQSISNTTREVIRAMDEIVWTINPKNDTVDNLANYIFQYAQEYFQNTGVRCRLDLPARLPDYPISTEARHNLFMVVKEALNNALKHARATEVRISLALVEPNLTILIADNGCGFLPEQALGAGDGLTNMKQRIARIGAQLVLDSSPGAGTRIKVEMAAR